MTSDVSYLTRLSRLQFLEQNSLIVLEHSQPDHFRFLMALQGKLNVKPI